MISMVLTELLPSDHLHALGVARLGRELEQADGALLLSERRPSDVENVFEPFQLDRAVHAEVGDRAARQLAGQRDVDRDGSVGGGWIFAADAARR